MSIIIDQNTKLIVQGVTGREGSFHAEQMLAYGTQVVAGVTPGKGGQTILGVPVFNTVREAVEATGGNASVIFVPAKFTKASVLEALDAGLKTILTIAEHVPVHDMMGCYRLARLKGARLFGPNSFGIISPGKSKAGFMAHRIFSPGSVGVISRSATNCYETVFMLSNNGIGQSTCIGVGGDMIPGSTFVDLLPDFIADPETKAVILIGEIGGNEEELAAEELETVIPLKGMRRIIAERMHQSLHDLARANHRMEVDMSECVRMREQLKALGVKVSYNDMVIRCVAKALTEFPIMNSSMTDAAIIQKHYVNVGMAVATDIGLLVPVIRNADKLSLAQIGETARDLGKRTREGGLNPDELTGGAFTVTNLGMFGVDSFTAVINAPEAGILAVGQMKKRAVVLEDDSIAVRPMMWLSLIYDHRIVDGAPAAQFLKRVKTLLENPSLLL